MIPGDARNVRLSTGLFEIQPLGGGLCVTGILSLIAIGQAAGLHLRRLEARPPGPAARVL